MKTEELINALAADGVSEPTFLHGIARWLVPALVLSAIGLILSLGVREDLLPSLQNPVSVLRFLISAALGALALRAAHAYARPDAGAKVFLPVIAVAVAAGLLWVWAWVDTPGSSRQMAVVGKTMVSCLVTIPVLSILPLAALFLVLRGGAPTSPHRAGTAAGLASGGFAAAIYALHCTEDSPLFYVTWYGLAIVIVTVVAGFLGPRVLRW